MQPAAAPDLRRTASTALFVLTAINLLNYLDRYVVSSLIESLKKEPSLRLTDTEVGTLGSGFIIVYMLTSPFFGALGDRYSRTRLIALGVAIWSVATAMGGFAMSFASLFVARAAVGIGEAAYGSISPAVLADSFPLARRGRVFAIFYMAIPVGTALGFSLGGFIDHHLGWRAAFFIAGLPGLLAAALVMTLHDPPRGAQDEGGPVAHGHAPPVAGAYRALLRNRDYVLTVLGYAAYTFALGALGLWMPSFLRRERGLHEVHATVSFGIVVVATGLVGTFLGGQLGDYVLRFTRQSYLWVSGVMTLLAVPCAAVALTSPEPHVYWTAMVAAELLIFGSTGPINSAIVNVVPATMRATAVAASIFAIHILGDVPSNQIISALSDRTSLGRAMLLVPAAIAVSGLIWCAAAWRGGASGRKTIKPA